MGQDFCKACENNCLSSLEGDLSNKQLINKPEEHIIFKNSEYTDNKTNPSILYTQYQLNDNIKDSENLTKNIYNNRMNYPHILNNTIDKNKLNEIIFNYRIKILIKYFRKFKILKNEILKKVIIENHYTTLNAINNNNYNKKNNKQLPDIDISPNNNYTFIGHKFNNKKEGYGLEIYSDINARYFGKFKNGKKNGLCRFSIYNQENSYFYFGEVSNNNIKGFGYYENSKNGTKYEGDWENSMRSGYGIEYYEDGSFYKGQFSKGRKNGIGIYKWKDKSYYEGQWYNNFLHGYGKYIYSDGTIYIGQWNYNKKSGLGEMTFSSNKKYIGFFNEDIRNGFGILFSYENKKAYIGFWSENKQNGLGKFINNEKCIYGKWENGKIKNTIDSENVFFNSMTNHEKIYKKNFINNNFEDFYNRISRILLI